MKYAFICLLMFSIIPSVFAQQETKNADARLLEYYQGQRYLEAMNYLQKIYPEPVGSDVKALSRLAYTAQMANKLPEAQSYYQRIYDIDTTNRGALLAMGNINLRRGNSQKAELFFKHILLLDTTNITVFTKLAAIAADKKDTTAAINYLQKANRLNVFDIDVAVDLSGFYIAQKNFDAAVKLLNKAAESDPDNIYILLSMANIYYKERKWPETLNVCKKLQSAGAADAQVYYKMGVAYYNIKNYACGAETFALIDNQDQTEYSCYFAALCYKGLKDYLSANTMLNNAIVQSVSANVGSYYAEMGDNNEQLKRNKSAVQAYLKALQFNEGPAFYMALANIYEKQQDKANARKYYKLALQSYQKETAVVEKPLNYYTIANLYDQRLKDTANAVKYYKKYLDSKPPQKQQNEYILYTQDRINRLQSKN